MKTKHRQSAMSNEMLKERQLCYGQLVEKMQAFKEHFDAAERWCDFIDPSTGAPFHADSSTTLLECDERYRSLGFEILELGCCKALCNKSFGQCLVMTSAFVQGEDVQSALPLLEIALAEDVKDAGGLGGPTVKVAEKVAGEAACTKVSAGYAIG
eukprot:symbB.v1.2.022003.t1/scaffold1932.1/size98745/5